MPMSNEQPPVPPPLDSTPIISRRQLVQSLLQFVAAFALTFFGQAAHLKDVSWDTAYVSVGLAVGMVLANLGISFVGPHK